MLYNTERPMNFDSVIGQQYIVESIRAQAKANKFFGVYLFGGHFGCGKTSMARILNLAANCERLDENGNPCLQCSSCKTILSGTPDIVEIDAATNTGVDSIRELRDSINFTPLSLKRKVYIIDEVHMLSKGAFNALLKVLEEPPAFVIFILCTTEIEAIPATIRSRSACYFFEGLTGKELVAHIENVATRNDITLLPGASRVIAKYSQGAVRNSLSILDQVSSLNKVVSAEMVQSLLGVSSYDTLFNFVEDLLTRNTVGAISFAQEIALRGKDFRILCDDMIEIVTDALIYEIASRDYIENTEDYIDKVSELVSITNKDRLRVLGNHLLSLKNDLRTSSNKSTLLSAIIRITTDTENSIWEITEKVRRLEEELLQFKKSRVQTEKREEAIEACPYEIDKVMSLQEDIIDEKTVMDIAEKELECVCCEEKSRKVEMFESESMNMPEEEGAINESIDCPDIPESLEESVGNQEFDPFELFFESESALGSMTTQQSGGKEVSDVIPDEMQENALLLIEQIASEHVIFATALKGCCVTKKTNGVVISTELEDIKAIIQLYLSLYEDRGFEAVKSIKL